MGPKMGEAHKLSYCLALEVICVHGNEGAVSVRDNQFDKTDSWYLPAALRREKMEILS